MRAVHVVQYRMYTYPISSKSVVIKYIFKGCCEQHTGSGVDGLKCLPNCGRMWMKKLTSTRSLHVLKLDFIAECFWINWHS